MGPLKSDIQPMGLQRVGHNLFGSLIWASLEAQLVKNLPAMWEIPWRRERLFPGFWPAEFYELCRKELNTTERLLLSLKLGSTFLSSC